MMVGGRSIQYRRVEATLSDLKGGVNVSNEQAPGYPVQWRDLVG